MNIFATCRTQKRSPVMRMSQFGRIINEFFHFHMHFAENFRRNKKGEKQRLNVKFLTYILFFLGFDKIYFKIKKTKSSFEISSKFVYLRFSIVVFCFSSIKLMIFFRIDKIENFFFVWRLKMIKNSKKLLNSAWNFNMFKISYKLSYWDRNIFVFSHHNLKTTSKMLNVDVFIRSCSMGSDILWRDGV